MEVSPKQSASPEDSTQSQKAKKKRSGVVLNLFQTLTLVLKKLLKLLFSLAIAGETLRSRISGGSFYDVSSFPGIYGS
jgi:hypothetical protein